MGYTVFLYNKAEVEANVGDKNPTDNDFELYLNFDDTNAIKCSTGVFTKNDGFSGGSIWTVMATVNEGNDLILHL